LNCSITSGRRFSYIAMEFPAGHGKYNMDL
jgi:hypothetical protein